MGRESRSGRDEHERFASTRSSRGRLLLTCLLVLGGSCGSSPERPKNEAPGVSDRGREESPVTKTLESDRSTVPAWEQPPFGATQEPLSSSERWQPTIFRRVGGYLDARIELPPDPDVDHDIARIEAEAIGQFALLIGSELVPLLGGDTGWPWVAEFCVAFPANAHGAIVGARVVSFETHASPCRDAESLLRMHLRMPLDGESPDTSTALASVLRNDAQFHAAHWIFEAVDLECALRAPHLPESDADNRWTRFCSRSPRIAERLGIVPATEHTTADFDWTAQDPALHEITQLPCWSGLDSIERMSLCWKRLEIGIERAPARLLAEMRNVGLTWTASRIESNWRNEGL